MDDPVRIAPNTGETFDAYIARGYKEAENRSQSILLRFDDANYLLKNSDKEIMQTQSDAFIHEFIERRVKRYCREQLGTLAKDASPEQREQATQAVWDALTPGKELSTEIFDKFSPKKQTGPLHESHPNVVPHPFNAPEVDWRKYITIHGPDNEYSDDKGFSAAQVAAIEHCLDEMTANIPEFRQLLLEFEEPHIRFSEQGDPQEKLMIEPIFNEKQTNHYQYSSNSIGLQVKYLMTAFYDRDGKPHSFNLQTTLAHELFHAVDVLSANYQPALNNKLKMQKEDEGAVQFERIINSYYGKSTRAHYRDISEREYLAVPDDKLDEMNWTIGTLQQKVEKPFSFVHTVERSRIRNKQKEKVSTLIENLKKDDRFVSYRDGELDNDYTPPNRPFSLFDRITISKAENSERNR